MLHPDSYHAYLIRRIDRLYYLMDVLGQRQHQQELQSKLDELKKIER